MGRMNTNAELIYFHRYERHKGFYKERDIDNALLSIRFADYVDIPDDEECPYFSANELLRGSCHIFALGLEKVLGYTPYIIEGKNNKSFHAFCQIFKSGTWFYVDARGVTTSFDEFMDVAKEFVTDEYIIRPVEADDIAEWRDDKKYHDEALSFAVQVITKYRNYYSL